MRRFFSISKYATPVFILVIALLSACGGSAEGPANSLPTNENTSGPATPGGEQSPDAADSREESGEVANVNGTTKNEQGDEVRTERISFAKGASSATVKGAVNGYNVVDYVVNARKGQTMSVSLKSSSTFSYFNVRGSRDGFASELDVNPKAMEETSWKAVLPKSGDYFIRVYLVRAEARRDGKASFDLTVSVTGGDKDKTAVSEKPVFYNCPERMEVVATMRAGGSRIELEIGDTVLRLDKVQSGSGAKYADAGEKNVISLRGKEAVLEYRGKSYTCSERQ